MNTGSNMHYLAYICRFLIALPGKRLAQKKTRPVSTACVGCQNKDW